MSPEAELAAGCVVEVQGYRCGRIIHVKSRGLCNAHYLQLRRGKPFSNPRKPPGGVEYKDTQCIRDSCESPVIARGLCGNHYSHFRKGQSFYKVYGEQRAWGSSSLRNESGGKECLGCKNWLDPDLFGVARRNPDGLNYRCRDCVRGIAPHPDSVRRGVLPSKRTLLRYNRDDQWFQETLEAQGGVCATCRTDKPTYRGWVVDHDHSCCPGSVSCGNCVRGLLCNNCNLSLGLLKDNTTTLKSLINYLEEHHRDRS